ncbi:RBBP9/YdeN family alpha/beta hydrolase [Caenispirillum bisanense]|uniref:Alpha/beta hydrolase n=1 Tax=Caenispirillum bisanense TaxID=414052 RepID=A0A286G6F0_9PROT|nr:alpha/beta hydrolase [Caenispirillum bisanense]SOD91075.1 hypothetical protein SAMN05421508_101796 [Caenispirillum bisanense]
MTTVLVVPGLGNSGPDHWQSHLETALPGCRRVVMGDWDKPDLQDWVQGLERAVQDAGDDPVVLLAHSLACATVAHWSREGRVDAVKAALLVAPADVDSRDHTPPEIWGFAPMPLHRLPFPATVVASRTDPFVAWDRAAAFAEAWGADFVDAGDAGHLNTDAGYGRWDYPASWLNALA